jgi:multisubunit Na+/H+ antiporter MnhB subunit
MSTPRTWRIWHTIGIVLAVALICWSGLAISPGRALTAWVLMVAATVVFALIAGHGITGLWKGALIDERNKMSLSRLQLYVWSVIVFSTLLTMALRNVSNGRSDALDIRVPDELLVLLGISATSSVLSPLVRQSKTEKPASEPEKKRTFTLLENQGAPTGKLTNEGQIVVSSDPGDARLSDLFRGEETGNAAQLDLGKIQMFYFTLALVIAYVALIVAQLRMPPDAYTSLPAMSASMVGVLALSHVGYVTNKAVPHSQTS